MDRHRDRTDLEKESRKKTSLVATCDVIKGVVVERDHRDATNVPLDKANYNTEHELLTESVFKLAHKHDIAYNGNLNELVEKLLEKGAIVAKQYTVICGILDIK